MLNSIADVLPTEANNHPLPFGMNIRREDNTFITDSSLLKEIEACIILNTLDVHKGNRTRAVKDLGIGIRTLQRKLKRWHMGEYLNPQHIKASQARLVVREELEGEIEHEQKA